MTRGECSQHDLFSHNTNGVSNRRRHLGVYRLWRGMRDEHFSHHCRYLLSIRLRSINAGAGRGNNVTPSIFKA